MHTKFVKFLNESSDNIKIKFIGEIDPKTLIPNFIEIGMDDEDIKYFCSWRNTSVSYFELRIPHNLQLDIEMLLGEYVDRGINRRGINGLDMNHDDYPDVSAYWFDLGNGIQSIAIGRDELNSSVYEIYSGDKELTNLLKNDLDDILTAKKYNL